MKGPIRTWALVLSALFALSPAAEARSDNHMWSAFVSARGGLFHNRFQNLSVQNTSGLGNVSASLAYSHYNRTSVFTVSGWASSLFTSDYNFGNFSVNASGSKALTPRARLHFGTGVADGFNYQDLIINGIFFFDRGVRSAFATGGIGYDFTPSTSGGLDLTYSRVGLDLRQQVDGSQFVFFVPGDEDVLVPILPDGLPFARDTIENAADASRLAASLLAAEGTTDAKVITESMRLSGGLSHQFTTRTNIDFRSGYSFITLDRETTTQGGDWYASTRLNHDFNFKTGASGTYIFRRNLLANPSISSHTGLGRVYRQISVPIRVDGNFGVTYYPIPTANGSGYQLIGGATLQGEFVRTAFNVIYQRRAQHSIGVGRFLNTNVANASVSYIFSTRLSGAAYVGYRDSRGTFEDRFAFVVLSAGGDLRWRLTEEFSVGASYLFRHLQRSGLNYDTHLLSIVLSYGKSWK